HRRPTIGGFAFLKDGENFAFDLVLDRIGEFVAVTGEDLDAVIAPWIVRRGDDHAGVVSQSPRQTSDSGCGDHAGAIYPHSRRSQPAGQRVADPAAGLARIL